MCPQATDHRELPAQTASLEVRWVENAQRRSSTPCAAIADAYAEAAVLQLRAGARVASSPPDWEAAVADLDAAVALLETIGARPALARVFRDLGRAQRGAGNDAAAEEIEQRARKLTDDLGLVVEPGMVP